MMERRHSVTLRNTQALIKSHVKNALVISKRGTAAQSMFTGSKNQQQISTKHSNMSTADLLHLLLLCAF